MMCLSCNVKMSKTTTKLSENSRNNVKMSKTTTKLSENSRNKHSSNSFQWCSVGTSVQGPESQEGACESLKGNFF